MRQHHQKALHRRCKAFYIEFAVYKRQIYRAERSEVYRVNKVNISTKMHLTNVSVINFLLCIRRFVVYCIITFFNTRIKGWNVISY